MYSWIIFRSLFKPKLSILGLNITSLSPFELSFQSKLGLFSFLEISFTLISKSIFGLDFLKEWDDSFLSFIFCVLSALGLVKNSFFFLIEFQE